MSGTNTMLNDLFRQEIPSSVRKVMATVWELHREDMRLPGWNSVYHADDDHTVFSRSGQDVPVSFVFQGIFTLRPLVPGDRFLMLCQTPDGVICAFPPVLISDIAARSEYVVPIFVLSNGDWEICCSDAVLEAVQLNKQKMNFEADLFEVISAIDSTTGAGLLRFIADRGEGEDATLPFALPSALRDTLGSDSGLLSFLPTITESSPFKAFKGWHKSVEAK